MRDDEALPDLLITDSEMIHLTEIINELNGKFVGRAWTTSVVEEMKSQAEQEFFEAGFIAEVNFGQTFLSGGVIPPEVSIIGRVEPVDMERYRAEIKAGVGDHLYKKK